MPLSEKQRRFAKMAILTHNGNTVEIRVKNTTDNTYYDEYVSVEKRDEPKSRECIRYIGPIPGTTYAIEITLVKVYNFGNCKYVTASLNVKHGEPEIGQVRLAATFNNDDIAMVTNKTVKLLGSSQLVFESLEVG